MSPNLSLRIVSLLLLTIGAAMASDTTPRLETYRGDYTYYETNRPHNVPFELTVERIEKAGAGIYKFGGRITEPRSDFGPHTAEIGSSFAGTWTNDGGTIHFFFVKIYDYDGHKVTYDGTCEAGESQASGHWKTGGITGPFNIKLP